MRHLYKAFTGKGRDSLLHRNLRLCTEEGLFATPFVILSIPGNLFIAALITQVLGLSAGWYGWIVSLPAWCNALQVAYMPLLASRYNARLLTICSGFINAVFWLLLILLLPRLHAAVAGDGAWLLFSLFLCLSLSQSITGVSWLSWIQEWIPGRLRGKYFGRRNAFMGFATVAFIFVGGRVLAWFDDDVRGFQVLLGIVGGSRLVSLYLQTFIYTPWSAPDRQIHEGWWRHYSGLARERPYFVFLLFTAVLTFLLNVTGPFVPVFMHYHLGLDVVAQTKFVLLGNLASALAIGYWGRLCDRYGCKPVIATTAMLWMASSCLWAVVTPALSWILYPMWLWGGMTSGGVVLGIFNLLLKLVPAKARTAAISVHLMATSVAAALAPVLVGTLLGAAARGSAEQLHLYRLLFVLQPCALLLSLLILAQVAEPQAQGLSSVIGALRTLRQTLLHNGYMVLANVVLMRGRRSRGR